MPPRPSCRLRTVLVALAAGLALLAGCSTTPPAPPAPRAPAAGSAVVADRWAAAWTDDEPAALAALFTPEATYEDLGFNHDARGTAAIREWAVTSHQRIGNLRVAVTDAFRSGDRIGIAWTFSGRLRGAPQPFSVSASSILRLEGEKIAEHRDFYNLATILDQSGLPAESSPGVSTG